MDELKKRLEVLESRSAQISENQFQSVPAEPVVSERVPPKPTDFDSPNVIKPEKKPAFQEGIKLYNFLSCTLSSFEIFQSF